ncbi:hypothetical protein ACFLZB_03115 [Nanoarchaeota archaeon]
MWPFKVEDNSTKAKQSQLEKVLRGFDPGVVYTSNPDDNTVVEERIIYEDESMDKSEVVTTFTKFFESEEAMKRELFMYAHYNDFGPILSENWNAMDIYDYGHSGKEGKWFIKMKKLGGGKDLAQRIEEEGSPEPLMPDHEKAVDNLAIMQVAAPVNVKTKKKKFKKAKQGFNRYLNNNKEDDKTDRATLWKGFNRMLNFLDISFFYVDDYKANLFEGGVKVDFDKAEFVEGDYDLAHIVAGLPEEQAQELIQRKQQKYQEFADKYNQYVEWAQANPKELVANLVKKYLNKTVAEELAPRIMAREEKSLDQYVKFLEGFGEKDLKDQIYMIKNHISNLKKVEVKNKDMFVQASRFVRYLATSGADVEFAQRDPDKSQHYQDDQMKQLQGAIQMAREMEHYAENNLSQKEYQDIHNMRKVLDKQYDQLKQKYQVAQPQRTEQLEQLVAA